MRFYQLSERVEVFKITGFHRSLPIFSGDDQVPRFAYGKRLLLNVVM